jgi:hypothetical protein
MAFDGRLSSYAPDGFTHQVHYMEGEVNKMLVDDKGTILLCAFGLPPRSHPDDALRAVRTALLLADLLGGDVASETDGIPLASSEGASAVGAEGAAPPPPPPKSVELLNRIVTALSDKPPFDTLDETQKQSLADAMVPLEAKAQDQLLNEGDEGQHCYLLDRGEVSVKVEGVEALQLGGIATGKASDEALVMRDRAILHLLGGKAIVLSTADGAKDQARLRLARCGEVILFQEPLDHACLIIGVIDGETLRQSDRFAVTAQHAGAEAVEGAHRHIACRLADHLVQAIAHLRGRLVREGHRKDLPRGDPLMLNQPGDAVRDHPRLP